MEPEPSSAEAGDRAAINQRSSVTSVIASSRDIIPQLCRCPLVTCRMSKGNLIFKETHTGTTTERQLSTSHSLHPQFAHISPGPFLGLCRSAPPFPHHNQMHIRSIFKPPLLHLSNTASAPGPLHRLSTATLTQLSAMLAKRQR